MVKVEVLSCTTCLGRLHYHAILRDSEGEERSHEFKTAAYLRIFLQGLRAASTLGRTEFKLARFRHPASLNLWKILPEG